ncbi:5'-methylthioadenosine/adenosylhomocysteine nucleosidase [Variovorax sp. HJSM1_2]|uniref:5'-methylthioadenosine/adenosylhomocysteine nucleosidase n=1 Tax=Variovorax sp. HJSM1_2 TaxID=3366263 RepID=UPI003BBC2477
MVKPIAILSALADEQAGLAELLTAPQVVRHAGRDFQTGTLHGQPVVLALSRIGKVAAATTATALIEHFGVCAVVFTGVAGGLAQGVAVGDLVVASSFVQHDMDASPLFPRFEVPLYGQAHFPTDAALHQQLLTAAQAMTQAGPARVHSGLVASGDRFVSSAAEVVTLRALLPEALAVEMEGAAVAQVCHDYGVPFAAVRTISDRADDDAHVDFMQFVRTVAGPYAQALLLHFLQRLPHNP